MYLEQTFLVRTHSSYLLYYKFHVTPQLGPVVLFTYLAGTHSIQIQQAI